MMTPAMARILFLLRQESHTVAQLSAVTGYADGTIWVSLMKLRQLGRVTKQGKLCRGAGQGSGRPQAIYAAVQI